MEKGYSFKQLVLEKLDICIDMQTKEPQPSTYTALYTKKDQKFYIYKKVKYKIIKLLE